MSEGRKDMLRLTPKEIDLAQEAITQFGTPEHNRICSNWLRNNPQSLNERTFPSLSHEVARIILQALRSHIRLTSARIKSGKYDEDDAADMGNDLIVTEAVASDLSRELGMGAFPH